MISDTHIFFNYSFITHMLIFSLSEKDRRGCEGIVHEDVSFLIIQNTGHDLLHFFIDQ